MMNEPEPDRALLDRLRAGDKSACAACVEKYSPGLYRLALRMMRDEAEAEDVVQETFLSAFKSIDSFEGRSELSTWLYRIATNEALMLIRRKKPEVNLEGLQADDPETELTPHQFVDWSSLPENELLSGEGKKVLDEAIRTLPENLRMVFLMRDAEGLSIKETADALGLTETNVKTRLLRARLHLRERLSAYYGENLMREEKND